MKTILCIWLALLAAVSGQVVDNYQLFKWNGTKFVAVDVPAASFVLTSNSYADPAWLTSMAYSKLTSKPTTLSGYGITDAYPLSGNPSGFLTSSALTPYLTTATAAGTYAPINSPTFTGTVGGITKSMVGLGSVDNTSDAGKPVSTAQQTALDLKAPLASPTFTGTVSGITKSMVGLGSVENTALSTWAGTSSLTTLGTITTGVWNGTAIGDSSISSATAWNAKQAGDSDLTSWAGVTRASGYDTFAGTPSSANLRGLLSDENGTGVALFNSATGVSFGTFTASSGDSILELAGGALSLSSTGAERLVITSTLGTDFTGGIYYNQGSDATGDVYYRDSNGLLKRLAIGTNGQVLSSNGTIPVWSSAGGGGGSGTQTFSGVDGGTAANDDLSLQGTSHSTRTSSYVFLQPNGGLVRMGNQTSAATATPTYMSFGGTYGSSGTGSSANLKWKLYDDGTAANDYGIGMSAGFMELRGGSGAQIGIYPDNGTTGALFSSSRVSIPLSTAATSTSSGALQVSGGVGIAKNLFLGETITGTEQGSTPAAPPANGFVIYGEDNGSGKTRLMVRFATGAAQQIAIEP